ncbi:MAG: thermonuclease family protein [Sphingomonadaceae bacterium]
MRQHWRSVAFLGGLFAIWVTLKALGLTAPETRSAKGETIAVRDGDTLRIGGDDHRLSGIDAPEYRQLCKDARGRDWPCGKAARAALAAAVRGHTITCVISARDDYGRAVASCTDERGADLAEAMIVTGLAISDDGWMRGPYADQADAAKTARRGLWAGRFETPADYRAAHPKRESFAVDSSENAR